jgi:hypothetical protein
VNSTVTPRSETPNVPTRVGQYVVAAHHGTPSCKEVDVPMLSTPVAGVNPVIAPLPFTVREHTRALAPRGDSAVGSTGDPEVQLLTHAEGRVAAVVVRIRVARAEGDLVSGEAGDRGEESGDGTQSESASALQEPPRFQGTSREPPKREGREE